MFKGLNKLYYSIGINFRTNELENNMLSNLYKTSWTKGMELKNTEIKAEQNVK